MLKFLKKIRWPYREDAVFSIFSFIVFTVPLAFSLLADENYETTKLAIWLAFFGCALILWVRKKSWKARSAGAKHFLPLNLPAAAVYFAAGLAFWALLSAALAPDKWYGFFGFYYRFTNSFVFLTLWVLTVVLLWEGLDRQRWLFLLKILCVDALVVAIKSLLENLGLTLYLGETTGLFFRAAPSFLGNPNFSAMFMAGLFPVALAVSWQSKTRFWKFFYAACGLCTLLSIAILASRGALLGLAGGALLGLVLLVVGRPDKKLLFKLAAGLAIALFLTLAIARAGRPAGFDWNSREDNINFRLQVWRQSWQAIIHHPLTGIGLGNFALFHERLPRTSAMGVFDDPHNLWILLAASGGLPLLLLFLGLIGYVSHSGLRRLRQTQDPLLLGGLCAVAVFMVTAAFTPVPIPCFLLLAVLLGGIASVSRDKTRQANLPLFSRWPVVLIGLLFVVRAAGLWGGQTALYFGHSAYGYGDYAKAAVWLNLSKILDPGNSLARSYLIASETRLGLNREKIAAEIEDMLRFHPRQANSFVLASNAYFGLYDSSKDQRFLDESLADMKQAAAIDPSYPDRFGELGFYYFMKNDYQTALHYLDYSLSLNPKLLPSLLVEAKIYQAQNDRSRFMAALERAYNLNPSDPNIKYFWLAAKNSPNIKNVPLNFIYSR